MRVQDEPEYQAALAEDEALHRLDMRALIKTPEFRRFMQRLMIVAGCHVTDLITGADVYTKNGMKVVGEWARDQLMLTDITPAELGDILYADLGGMSHRLVYEKLKAGMKGRV